MFSLSEKVAWFKFLVCLHKLFEGSSMLTIYIDEFWFIRSCMVASFHMRWSHILFMKILCTYIFIEKLAFLVCCFPNTCQGCESSHRITTPVSWLPYLSNLIVCCALQCSWLYLKYLNKSMAPHFVSSWHSHIVCSVRVFGVVRAGNVYLHFRSVR